MPIGGYEYSKQLSGAPASCQRPLYLPAPELRAKVLELITHAHDAPLQAKPPQVQRVRVLNRATETRQTRSGEKNAQSRVCPMKHDDLTSIFTSLREF